MTPNLPSRQQNTSLAFHWYHGIVLYQNAISRPAGRFTGAERDALYVAAAVLGAATFAHVVGDTPEDVWPVKSGDPLALDWLYMSDGKKILWEHCDPGKPGETFQRVVGTITDITPIDGSCPIPPRALHKAFHNLFAIEDSTQDNSPYHVVLSCLAQALTETMTEENLMRYLWFFGNVDPRYRRLLEHKDPRALLLLAWWYAQVTVHISWWTRRRSLIEGQAICLYLERNCKDDKNMMELLEFPRETFRVVKESESTHKDRRYLMHSNFPNMVDDGYGKGTVR